MNNRGWNASWGRPGGTGKRVTKRKKRGAHLRWGEGRGGKKTNKPSGEFDGENNECWGSSTKGHANQDGGVEVPPGKKKWKTKQPQKKKKGLAKSKPWAHYTPFKWGTGGMQEKGAALEETENVGKSSTSRESGREKTRNPSGPSEDRPERGGVFHQEGR